MSLKKSQSSFSQEIICDDFKRVKYQSSENNKMHFVDCMDYNMVIDGNQECWINGLIAHNVIDANLSILLISWSVPNITVDRNQA